MIQPESCMLCPRGCGANRAAGKRGFCGADGTVRIARAAPHHWEEPPLSGTRGAGCVFFTGCPLHCVYCQNYTISDGGVGRAVTVDELCDIFLDLQAQGVHNLDLVTPTQYRPWITAALDRMGDRRTIPVCYNTSGYETLESIEALRGYVDIYLPDCKYLDPARSERYSHAPDYFEVALPAIQAMCRQVGPVAFDADGILQRGVILRHLVLPHGKDDSIALLERLADALPVADVRLSLMRQYVPCHQADRYPEINRRVSTYEYNKVLEKAQALGFQGFTQGRESAVSEYTPDFEL